MRVLLALLLVAAAARAGTLHVGQAPIEMLHAQPVDLTERFELVRIELAKTLVGARRLDGAEISEAMTPAGTPLSRGHWTYVVTLQEATPDAAPSGAFDLTLSVPGARGRPVRLVQNVSDALLPEGARVSFDLERDLPQQPLFVLTLVKATPQFELTSGVDGDLQYVWTAGTEENPTLPAAAGEEIAFTITNGDGTAPHNLRILDGNDPPPSTEDVHELGGGGHAAMDAARARGVRPRMSLSSDHVRHPRGGMNAQEDRRARRARGRRRPRTRRWRPHREATLGHRHALRGTLHTVGELFVVDESTFGPVVATLADAGVAGAPVEMASPPAEARAGLVQDQWSYRVKIQEAVAGGVGTGRYSVELQVNGVTLSTLYIEQGSADANAVEGVVATFGLGPEVPTSSLYYVVGKPYVPTGPTAAFSVRSATGDQWVGQGGTIEGAVNPTLNVPLGATLRITAIER